MTGSAAAVAQRLSLVAHRARGQREIPVVVGIDVEPDARVFPPDAPKPWRGFEQITERLPALRERLQEVNGRPVAFTWFLRMDPQVEIAWGSATWVVEQHGDRLARLRAAGDELGIHTHAWRLDEERAGWVGDYADHAWAEHCLETGFDAYEEALGEPCRVHRFGDHFMSGAILDWLSRRGVHADYTLEPGWPPVGPSDGERWDGLLPDLREVPLQPYRSSSRRFPAPEEEHPSPTLLVPLFSPPGLRRRQRLPLPPDSRHFVSRLAFELTYRTPKVMALVMRSDASLRAWEQTARNLEHLARNAGVRFVTASEAASGL